MHSNKLWKQQDGYHLASLCSFTTTTASKNVLIHQKKAYVQVSWTLCTNEAFPQAAETNTWLLVVTVKCDETKRKKQQTSIYVWNNVKY